MLLSVGQQSQCKPARRSSRSCRARKLLSIVHEARLRERTRGEHHSGDPANELGQCYTNTEGISVKVFSCVMGLKKFTSTGNTTCAFSAKFVRIHSPARSLCTRTRITITDISLEHQSLRVTSHTPKRECQLLLSLSREVTLH